MHCTPEHKEHMNITQTTHLAKNLHVKKAKSLLKVPGRRIYISGNTRTLLSVPVFGDVQYHLIPVHPCIHFSKSSNLGFKVVRPCFKDYPSLISYHINV